MALKFFFKTNAVNAMIGMKRSGAKAQVQISHKSFRNIGLIGRPDKVFCSGYFMSHS